MKNRKIIYINAIGLTGKQFFGIHRNTVQLLYELDKKIEKGEIVLVIPENRDVSLCFKNILIEKIGKITKIKGSSFIWKNIKFKKYVKKMGGVSVDMLLTLAYSGYDIVSIYDCIVEKFPQNANTFKKKISRLLYIKKIKCNLKKCKFVLTDSESAKNDISKFYKYSLDKIYVIPCAWQHFQNISSDNSILDVYGLTNKNYYFSLGSRYYHKNFKWIACAAKENPNDTFVITGSNLLNSSDNNLEKENIKNLIFTGYLSDSQIKSLMSNCKAFIQPSLYEGFGIPPMEAMSVGARCIVSDRGSLPEVYKNSVYYINPEKYDNINLEEIMSGNIESNDVILNEYSWEKSSDMLFDVLSKLR